MTTLLDPKWALFIKVAELGTISGAAAALNLPQSVVSRQISQLESDAGARLFRRTGRGVVLTEFGEEVHPRIVRLGREADQLVDDMRTRSGMPIGNVCVGLLPSAVPMLTGPLLSEVIRLWPQVRLHFAEGSSAQLEEWLDQGRLDMALLLREGDSARSDDAVLLQLPLYLVANAGSRLFCACRTNVGWHQLVPGARHTGKVAAAWETIPSADRDAIRFTPPTGRHRFVFIEAAAPALHAREQALGLRDPLRDAEIEALSGHLLDADITWRWGEVVVDVA